MAIAVGDVMGKGVKAAAGMGRVRNALRALALNDPRPAAVLAGLDRLFSATEDVEQFTTLAYAVIDPATGEGVLSNAGHLPPLLIFPGGTPQVSSSGGRNTLWAGPLSVSRQDFPSSPATLWCSTPMDWSRTEGVGWTPVWGRSCGSPRTLHRRWSQIRRYWSTSWWIGCWPGTTMMMT